MIGAVNVTHGDNKTTIFCDTASDVSGLEDFAREHELKIGSTAYVIATGEVYMMQSDYTWVKQ